jgi:hypothetical protein
VGKNLSPHPNTLIEIGRVKIGEYSALGIVITIEMITRSIRE